MKKINPIVLVAVLMQLLACSMFQSKPEKNADELANDGLKAFQKKQYTTAIENFEKIKDWYPFSQYAPLAELKIADSYFELSEYDKAIVAYEEFENLHPRNEYIPYVIYQIGQCYFEQIKSIDRDQSVSQKALSLFKRLVKQYPESEYADQAKPKINTCTKNLAEHELYVGLFYFKTNHYKAALKRFEMIISDYPEMQEIHRQVDPLIVLCKQYLISHKESE
ncbi:MAG: outer membrane protein assembly factor BamD [Desulfobacterales bacterium]|nr:outer membrane protein assembly factor BamD [Desulfobacterales bacterium]